MKQNQVQQKKSALGRMGNITGAGCQILFSM